MIILAQLSAYADGCFYFLRAINKNKTRVTPGYRHI